MGFKSKNKFFKMFVAKLELCLLALIDSGDPLGHCHVHDEQLSIYLASGQCIQAKCMGEGGGALRNRAAGEEGALGSGISGEGGGGWGK